MTDALTFRRMGAGFVLDDPAGNSIATFVLAEAPGETVLSMTVGAAAAEARLPTADTAHLRDLAAQAHARACRPVAEGER